MFTASYLDTITFREYLHMGPNVFDEIRRRGWQSCDYRRAGWLVCEERARTLPDARDVPPHRHTGVACLPVAPHTSAIRHFILAQCRGLLFCVRFLVAAGQCNVLLLNSREKRTFSLVF